MVTTEKPATSALRSGSRRTRSILLGMLGIGALMLLGANAVANTTVVVAVILVIAILPLSNSRPVVWIALAVTLPWTSRLLTTTGLAPRFLDFLDFPLVLIAFLFAGFRHLGEARLLPANHARIGRYLLLVTIAIVLSWAFNDVAEPQRLIAGWVLAAEPFLLLVAVTVAPMTERERKRLLVLVAILLCGQVLFSAMEIAAGARLDDVKGTLLQAGAGHHVSAGGLILGFFLLMRLGVPRVLAMSYGAAAIVVSIISDAKQVLFVVPVAMLVLAVSGRKRRGGKSLIGAIVTGAVMAGASAYALLSYQASEIAFDFIDKTSSNETGKVAVVFALWSDLKQSLATMLFGLGPGQSVSRFAFLTTPELLKEGSPVYLLGLKASRGADHYNEIAFSGPFTGKSSFTSAQSSVLGIVGDYGLVGLAAFLLLAMAVFSALRKAPDHRLRSAALASWTLLIPLAIIFDWLEQPPFTLAVMLITGLALRSTQTLQAVGEPPATNADPLTVPMSVLRDPP
jgi:hypothetical protein